MKDLFDISFDESGVKLTEKLYPIFRLRAFLQGEPTVKIQEIPWHDIVNAYVYKRDVFTCDLICLMLRTTSGRTMELNEQMEGWQDLIANLPNHLPACRSFDEWFAEVAFPAFELNLTEIYRKEI
jgi:hypothetical protein